MFTIISHIKFRIIKLGLSIICIFFFLVLQSCKKEKNVVVAVELRDFYSNAPLSDFNINIMQLVNKGFGQSIKVIDSIKTNSEGKFIYSFTASSKYGYSYHLNAGYDKYQGFEEDINKYSKSNYFNKKLKPLRVIILKALNKTHEFQYIRPPDNSTWMKIFHDTTFVLNKIIPDDTYKLKISFHKCMGCSIIERNENIWIENVDTTFLTREY